MTRTLKQGAAFAALAITLSATVFVGRADAQSSATADLSGSYKCQPNPLPCLWSGQTPSISQSGKKIEVKGDGGQVAAGMLTSDTTLSVGGPLNSYGTVRPDDSIDWSNGNIWHKQ